MMDNDAAETIDASSKRSVACALSLRVRRGASRKKDRSPASCTATSGTFHCPSRILGSVEGLKVGTVLGSPGRFFREKQVVQPQIMRRDRTERSLGAVFPERIETWTARQLKCQVDTDGATPT